MTPSEKRAYVKTLNFQEGESNYIKTWVDSSYDAPPTDQKRIKLRSSYSCGINVKLYIHGPADTARVTVYKANTSTIVHGPVLMTGYDDFDMTIDGDTDYDFKLEPIDNPSSSTSGNFIVDPDWGSKTVYYFSGAGPHLFEDFNFECPTPSPDGTSEAAVAIDKYSGSATKYKVNFDDGSNQFTVDVSGDLTYKPFTIDETKTYNVTIDAFGDNSGNYEDYTVQIARPDQIVHVYYMYHPDTTAGIIKDNITYFECPY